MVTALGRPKLAPKLRARVLRMARAGHTPTEIAAATGVSRATVRNWIAEHAPATLQTDVESYVEGKKRAAAG
jgi:DNA invertase Pin-like site-specific DNA recombinase